MTEEIFRIRTVPLVDAHIHPDKTSWGGPWLSRNRASTLREFIADDLRTQQSYERSVAERAEALFRTAIAAGTRAMRAHIDVGPPLGLGNLHGVLEAVANVRELLDVQLVAFPQQGLVSVPGTRELIDAALHEGADVVGGIDPVGMDGDLVGHLDTIFQLAESHGADVDIHLHDDGALGLSEIRGIAARTIATGMQGRVTISHAYALATASADARGPVADAVAEAGVWLTTCGLGEDPVLPAGILRSHGVRTAVGSDGVRDSWSPFGTANMLDRAHLYAYRTGAITDDELEHAFELCSSAGAELVGLSPSTGDWIEYDGESIAQVVVDRPAPAAVYRDGRRISPDGRFGL